MTLINDPDNLSQGASTAAADAVWGTPTGNTVTVTSAGTNLPSISAGDFIAVRDHSDSVNNGLYQESGGSPTTGSITMDKVSGANPIAAASEAVTFLGTTGDALNIFWDTAARHIYLLEQNGLSADGVLGNTIYSKAMIDWKDDDFLIANAPFPMFMIDRDAGKLLVGQDASGNNNGWNWQDDSGFSIRTRKLVRNLGWSEVDSDGRVTAVYTGVLTLGTFEDPANDTAYFQFGTDTTVDDTVDFDFAGPVNEAVAARQDLADGAINGGTGVTIDAAGRVLTRSDGGDWRTDGFIVGGRIELRDAENPTSDGSPFLLSVVGAGVDGAVTVGTGAVATPNGFDFVDGGGGNDQIVRNDGLSWRDEGYFVGGVVVVANATTGANDGTHTILAITDTTIDVATATLTADTDDNTATFGPLDPTGSPDTAMNATIDNLNDITLRNRVRDADPNGKTFTQADLSNTPFSALGGLVIPFPLSNDVDLKINETDANIDSQAPYTGMTLTIYATPQSLGGDLVGGPYNFGFQVDANGGTSEEVHEWLQRQLRKTTDIDNDADTAIGRAIDGLSRFNGDAAIFGQDQGTDFPLNPQGGGSGVYVANLAAGSKNTTTMYDNTGTERSFPVVTPVTLDFNQTLIDDSVAEYTLFFDYTIRTTVGDLIVTAGTGANGTFDSAGANLPATLDNGAGAYVRITGLTGADAPMNGVYQVTALTSTSQWDVTRYDGATIVTTSSASIPVDEHPLDSPDAVIVQDDTPVSVTGLTSGGDVNFSFDYTNNVQGGRSGGTDADVVCKAIGQQTAQYTQSTVQTIESVTPKTIPVTAQIERNFDNPA